jgi:hypothetical protein
MKNNEEPIIISEAKENKMKKNRFSINKKF